MKPSRTGRFLAVTAATTLTFIGGGLSSVFAVCGPFVDVDGPFCPFILEIYYMGITTGTSSTTYSPNAAVTRGQMAAFLARTLDRSLSRGSRRAALDQWWKTAPYTTGLGLTAVGVAPTLLKSDGVDVWVANSGGSVSRVRASDGKLLETWTGATGASGVLIAMGRVFVTGSTGPGQLYVLDPSQPAGAVATLASTLGSGPKGITFDGLRIWTANRSGPNGSVSIIFANTWAVSTISTGFVGPGGILFDGSSVWVADEADNAVKKLDTAGNIVQTVAVGTQPALPAFDGSNIWVPNYGSNTVTVIRTSDGGVLQTLSGNGLNAPIAAAFDGQRILVTNFGGGSVSIYKAADFSPIGSFPLPASSTPYGACSDGVNFWVSLNDASQVARF